MYRMASRFNNASNKSFGAVETVAHGEPYFLYLIGRFYDAIFNIYIFFITVVFIFVKLAVFMEV